MTYYFENKFSSITGDGRMVTFEHGMCGTGDEVNVTHPHVVEGGWKGGKW